LQLLHAPTVAVENPGRVAVLAAELAFHRSQEIIGARPDF
jgi:hypothetical protein